MAELHGAAAGPAHLPNILRRQVPAQLALPSLLAPMSAPDAEARPVAEFHEAPTGPACMQHFQGDRLRRSLLRGLQARMPARKALFIAEPHEPATGKRAPSYEAAGWGCLMEELILSALSLLQTSTHTAPLGCYFGSAGRRKWSVAEILNLPNEPAY